jgi:hypothetical protein
LRNWPFRIAEHCPQGLGGAKRVRGSDLGAYGETRVAIVEGEERP